MSLITKKISQTPKRDAILISRFIESVETKLFQQCITCTQEVLSQEAKPILRSAEEKELVWRHQEDLRKLVVKNFSETFVKNAFHLLWIRML